MNKARELKRMVALFNRAKTEKSKKKIRKAINKLIMTPTLSQLG